MPVNNRLNPDDANISPFAVGAAAASVTGAVFYSHKALLANSGTYAKKTYDVFKTLEDKSPGNLFRTAGLSELASSYLTDNVHIPYADLVRNYLPTPLAGHLDRLIDGGFSSVTHQGGLTFHRLDSSSPYLHLSTDSSIKVRFNEEGRLGASSFRYGAPIKTKPYEFLKSGDASNPLRKAWGNSQALRHGQDLKRPVNPRLPDGSKRDYLVRGTKGVVGDANHLSLNLYPYLAEREGQTLSNISNKASRIGFELLERPQKLLADFGLGLKSGSYNKMFHMPFIGEGRGLVNDILGKRVLPAYLALGVALPYLDYKLHHAPSNAVINAYQAVSVGKAKLTDSTPLRSITDTYARIVPGPQYGPLALPLGGMFAGALLHYKDVLTDKFPTKEARAANFRIFAKEGEETLFKVLNKNSPVAKGLAIGAALMLPLIPGMLGSRKSAGELEDIYSGAQPVPVRSGRWWEVGLTPFSGSTIKSFRPHWSALWKAQAEKASIYGGEDNYWGHNPLLHPIKAFKDPYWLEKQNYRDRPYPITSPAFSNVPLIGPLLAATVGKLVKPVVRMHTEDWDGKTDYNLYSTRLEPKGPRVESKFEKEVLEQLSERGFKADTQTPIDNYRADFTLQGNGKKIVIEADGDTYHTNRNARADEQRQKDIEAAGWDVIRVRSTPFFSDPSTAMNPVFARLSALGIQPVGDGGNVKSGLIGYANPTPKEEFGVGDTIHREANIFSDFIGLPGFVGRSIYDKLFPDNHKDVYLQGSRNIDSTARRYYERELGAGYFIAPGGLEDAGLGYSEPLRRFIQPELKRQQANEIPNALANVDWIPGDDYYIDYKKGDPYSRIEDGYARLPGAGYAALHPELKGVDPNDYPDINKLEILADIGPYSRQYQAVRGRVAKLAANDTDINIEYSRILDRVQQVKDSALGTENRIFSGKVESIDATVDDVDASGFTTKEYPGRKFKLSGLGTSAADMAAIAIGENNKLTRAALDEEVEEKRSGLGKYLQDTMGSGTRVHLTVPFNSINNAQTINAVVKVGSSNVNSQLLDNGYARFDRRQAGPEVRDIFGGLTKALGTFAEEASFTGDEEVWNPLRYVPTPAHTKLWQNRDPLADYQEKEVYGSNMRRWDKPIHDFIMPYTRGAIKRTTGYLDVPTEVQEKRELNSITDSLKYLRSKILANTVPGERSKYTNQGLRTFAGVDLFSEASYVASTLPRREALYFMKFVKETDPDKRQSILASVSKPTAEALEAQWLKAKANIAQAEGKDVDPVDDGGRILTKEGLAAYKNSNTKLGYGDFTRSLEIAKVFTDRNYQVPTIDSDVFSSNIDYDDVKLKIIQLEGYDAKDFNIFDDRSNVLWRKPYIDGAVSELTSGTGNSLEENRRLIENILIASNNKNPKVSLTSRGSRVSSGVAQIDIERDDQNKLLTDMRRRPEQYN